MNKQQMQVAIGGGFILSFATGSAAGYFFAKKKLVAELSKQFDERLEKEVEATKAFYRKLNKTDEFADPEQLAEKYKGEKAEPEVLAEAISQIQSLEYGPGEEGAKQSSEEVLAVIESQGYTETIEGEVQVKHEVVSVFATTSQPPFDIEVERKQRRADRPYIISEEEHLENDGDFQQLELTYFVADEILVDEQDSVVPDNDILVGDSNLERFGYGSNDANVLYVRNEEMQLDFMITRHHGNYGELSMGPSDDSLQHSAIYRTNQRFRR